jgi:hypothetical protein
MTPVYPKEHPERRQEVLNKLSEDKPHFFQFSIYSCVPKILDRKLSHTNILGQLVR